MADEIAPLTKDNEFQIDFNFQQVPSALSVEIPVEAAALMLKITPAQFSAYVDRAFAECTRIAQLLLDKPGTKDAIRRLKAPHRGSNISTVMTAGDSITTYRYGYAEILRALLTVAAPEPPVQFYNHGRSGYTSTHALEHAYTIYVPQKPDWVFLKYGANDMKCFGGTRGKLLVSLPEYIDNLTHVIDAFLHSGAKVIVLTPTPIVESIVNSSADFQAVQMTWENANLRACADALLDIAHKRGIPAVDLVTAFSTQPDPALYCPDGLHPGPAGHQIIIEKVLDAVNSYSS